MAAGTIDARTGVLDVLSSTADDGEVRCKLGYALDSRGVSASSHAWGMDGFVSRPNDPTAEGAAMAFYLQDANRRYVLASKDNRFADKVGTMDPGDRAIVTDGEARIFVKQQRDAVSLYTVNQVVDQSMLFDMGGLEGKTKWTNGKCFIEMIDDGVKASVSIGISGGASITLFEDGTVSIDGAYFNCATGGGRLGVLAPQTPGPPAPLGSILFGPAGQVGVASAGWTVTP